MSEADKFTPEEASLSKPINPVERTVKRPPTLAENPKAQRIGLLYAGFGTLMTAGVYDLLLAKHVNRSEILSPDNLPGLALTILANGTALAILTYASTVELLPKDEAFNRLEVKPLGLEDEGQRLYADQKKFNLFSSWHTTILKLGPIIPPLLPEDSFLTLTDLFCAGPSNEMTLDQKTTYIRWSAATKILTLRRKLLEPSNDLVVNSHLLTSRRIFSSALKQGEFVQQETDPSFAHQLSVSILNPHCDFSLLRDQLEVFVNKPPLA